ncbi:MAG: inositol monophosphatase [Chloroflexi bacterium]|nr:MAG: inositol monophosphatase [Chloroflexota bacterium]
MSDKEFLSVLLEVGQETAVSAGRLLRDIWSQPRQISEKAYRDIVTDADVAAQKLITDNISRHFPDHGFLTEESDIALAKNGRIIWIIDPVDGTTNYSRQQPNYCVSIAAALPLSSPPPASDTITFDLLVGIIYDPVRDELFYATKGGGSYLNGKPISVSPLEELAYAVIAIDLSRNRQTRRSTLELLPRFADEVMTTRIVGTAALTMAWVAAGRADAYMNFNLKPWDIAAAEIIVREAGGTLTTIDGQPLVWRRNGGDCLASNGRIHQPFLSLLNGHP